MQAAITEASAPPRELPGDKATRIVEAMRASVAARGIAGSTFDHVAREAGVSRGLLHYYFGTKERLLSRWCVGSATCSWSGSSRASRAPTAPSEVLDALVATFEDFLGEGRARR